MSGPNRPSSIPPPVLPTEGEDDTTAFDVGDVFTSAATSGLDALDDPLFDDEDEDDRTMMAVMAIDELVGQVISGRYDIRRIIGEGGTGKVYEATDMQTGEFCALKLLSSDVKGGEFVKRFLREIRIISALDSPHIVRIMGAGRLADQRPFLVEELLMGCTLTEVIAGRPMALDRAVRLVDQIFCGLEAAHSAGVVHRDLKPDNIFINHPGTADEHAKVLDFGFAIELDQKLDRRLTAVGMAVGTPRYMAPEQFLQDAVDGRADLYATGVLLYLMLTGRTPFELEDEVPDHVRRMAEPARIGWMHIYQEVVRHPNIPDLIWPLLQRLLAKSDDDRYPDATATRAALKALTQPVQPSPDPGPINDTPTLPQPVAEESATSIWIWVVLASALTILGAMVAYVTLKH